MSIYSIKELGQISGILPHTIRIWEQRYDLLKPLRSETNIRYYDDEQLKKLLNVCELINSGMKISHISKLSKKQIDSEIDILIAKSFQDGNQFDSIVNQIIISLTTFDESLFDKMFSNSILRFGLTETYLKVIYPVLVRIGLMWIKNDIFPAQEHFLTNLIKQKLFVSIDSLPLPKSADQTWVLFLKENEEHEIGLLFANYIIRQQGKRVVYLGSNVPRENLSNVIKHLKATHVYTFFTKNHSIEEVQHLLDNLSLNFKKTKLFVSGNRSIIEGVQLNKQVKWIQEIDSLVNILKN